VSHKVETFGNRHGGGHLAEAVGVGHLVGVDGPRGWGRWILHALVARHGLGVRTIVSDRGWRCVVVHRVLPVLTLSVIDGRHETLLSRLSGDGVNGSRVGSSMVGAHWRLDVGDIEVFFVRRSVGGRSRKRVRGVAGRGRLDSSCFGRGFLLSRGLVDFVGDGFVYTCLARLFTVAAGFSAAALDLSIWSARYKTGMGKRKG
jgi:hypothetical protein